MHAVHMHSKPAEVSRSKTFLGVNADMPTVQVLAEDLLDIATSCACTPSESPGGGSILFCRAHMGLAAASVR